MAIRVSGLARVGDRSMGSKGFERGATVVGVPNQGRRPQATAISKPSRPPEAEPDCGGGPPEPAI